MQNNTIKEDLVQEIIAYIRDTDPRIKNFLDKAAPYREILTKPDSSSSKGFSALLNLYTALHNFTQAVLQKPSPNLSILADIVTKDDEIQKKFKELNDKMPSPNDLNKITNSKQYSKFVKDVSETGIVYAFNYPFTIAAKLERFWSQVLNLVPAEDAVRGLYQACRQKFKAIDHKQTFERNAAKFSKQLEQLKAYGKQKDIIFPNDMKLHWCIHGSVMAPPQQPPIPAYLFIFEDRLALMRSDKVVKCNLILNVWILPSAMYPRNLHVVDVLTTDFSFAFQPENLSESDALWKSWNVIANTAPLDYNIYQPVMLSNDPPPQLEWVEINE